jgi:hypothetical protein
VNASVGRNLTANHLSGNIVFGNGVRVAARGESALLEIQKKPLKLQEQTLVVTAGPLN